MIRRLLVLLALGVAFAGARVEPVAQNESVEEVKLLLKGTAVPTFNPNYVSLSLTNVEPVLYQPQTGGDKRPNLGDTIRRARRLLKSSSRSMATLQQNIARSHRPLR